VSGLSPATIRAAELGTSDHMPECPACRELNHPGSTVCSDCGTHLTLKKPRRTVRSLPDFPVCPTCLREVKDSMHCDGCGRRL
jgi:predicted amidophosphoribosyltransferase